MIDSKTLGESCRDLRKDLNITQEDLAEAAGVTRQTVINFENGKADSFKLLVYFLSLKPDLVNKILNKRGNGTIEILIISVLVLIVAFLIISMGV